MLSRWIASMCTSRPHTALHRWCVATSDVYKNSCNWEHKVDAAMRDNTVDSKPIPKTTKEKRDPINAMLADGFGF